MPGRLWRKEHSYKKSNTKKAVSGMRIGHKQRLRVRDRAPHIQWVTCPSSQDPAARPLGPAHAWRLLLGSPAGRPGTAHPIIDERRQRSGQICFDRLPNRIYDETLHLCTSIWRWPHHTSPPVPFSAKLRQIADTITIKFVFTPCTVPCSVLFLFLPLRAWLAVHGHCGLVVYARTHRRHCRWIPS